MCVHVHAIALPNSAPDCFSASLMGLCSVEELVSSLLEAGLWFCQLLFPFSILFSLEEAGMLSRELRLLTLYRASKNASVG